MRLPAGDRGRAGFPPVSPQEHVRLLSPPRPQRPDALTDVSPYANPVAVYIVFSELLAVQDVNLNLFEDPMEKMRLAYLIDELNERFEEQAVQVGGLHGTGGQVPKRIPFGAPESGECEPCALRWEDTRRGTPYGYLLGLYFRAALSSATAVASASNLALSSAICASFCPNSACICFLSASRCLC
jgi:hypothetical protein